MRLSLITSTLLLSAMMVFTGCNDDDDTPASSSSSSSVSSAVSSSSVSSSSVSSNSSSAATQPLSMNILHMNDIHSHLASETYSLYMDLDGNAENKNETRVKVQLGGMPRATQKIKSLQATYANVLTLNAGDMMQGTLYFTSFEGEATAAMLNQIHWDAFELGNHEFDNGDQFLADFLGMFNPSIDVLAANVVPQAGSILENKWTPYVIKEIGGQKVGIIGIDIKQKTEVSSNPSDQITFLEELSTAQKYADELSAMGINKIVLLTHVGYKNDLDMAGKLSNVDIIIGGDSHTLMGDFSAVGLTSGVDTYPFMATANDGNPVCIAQAWQYSYIVGDVEVNFDEDGVVTSCNGHETLIIDEPFEINDAEANATAKAAIMQIIAENSNVEIVQEDPAAAADLQPYTDQLNEIIYEVVGYSNDFLGHNRIPYDNYDKVGALPKGSDIAPIVCAGFMQQDPNADLCIQNAGGVRTPVNEGNITIDTAYTLLPFKNTLFEIEMKGSEIKQVLEDALANYIDNGGSTGSFPYAYALRYDINASKPANERISGLEVMDKTNKTWSAIDDNVMYTVITNSYTGGGKDGYVTFKTVQDERGPGVDTYLDYAMSFVTYVKSETAKNGGISKLPAEEHPIKCYVDDAHPVCDPNPDLGGGKVVLFDIADGMKMKAAANVGHLPDMVKFTSDGMKVLSANEGEPSDDYSVDPLGSVSIIDISNGADKPIVRTVDFTSITQTPDGAKNYADAPSVAADFEPEYIAIDSENKTAWVTLQENNALAVIDIENASLKEVAGLGFKDFSASKIDIYEDGKIDIKAAPSGVFGMFQPDTIAAYEVGGETYLVTANEGDDREYDAYEEETKSSKLTTTVVLEDTIRVTPELGDAGGDGVYEELYMMGTRSFSIWKSDGTLVYDSGSDFEEKIAADFPTQFNTRVDDTENTAELDAAGIAYTLQGEKAYFFEGLDARSPKKGAEPEALTVGTIGSKTFAFIGLEKQGGFFVYDITNPAAPVMIQYFNDIDYTKAPSTDMDLEPEGFRFVPATEYDGNKNLLIAASEMSSTIAIYEIANDGTASKVASIKNSDELDAGATEIVDYCAMNKAIFVTNGDKKTVDVFDISNLGNITKTASIDITPYGSGIQSVAVKNGILAVAVER